MSDEASDATEDGLRIVRLKAHNLLAPMASALPRQVVTAMWRADFRSWLLSERPSLVHFHNPHPPGALARAAADCSTLGIPYVISTHGFVEFSDNGGFLGLPAVQRRLFRSFVTEPVARVARSAARVLMLSPQEESILLAMGVDRARLEVVTNGVDHYFGEATQESERLALTARFNLPPGRPIVFFVGNHTANKGIDVLLRAIPLLKSKAVIVIGGAIRSEREHAALLASARLQRDDPRLLFTDFITKEELRALYQSADVFAFPSYADTLPLVILEAMTAGLPVVATRVGGIPYEVTPETGELIGPGDPTELAAGIDKLITSGDLRKLKGAAGRTRCLELFDWDKSAAKAVAIYAEILSVRS
ncbi:MAG: glycosyltransferase family 4 protein [Alphaproteobacteria bacterium]|nr:glycosyltransferase family 4 protein [Alphaproteobacteria bacterium]MBL7099789.1 glycosyltransferase family 4 protein [Alphaproteobacteria bacterium]